MSNATDGPDPFYLTLGNVLKELRLRSGLTGDQLDHILTRAYLAKVEAGQVQPGLTIVRKLCETYGTPPSLMLIAVEARLARIPLQERAEQVLGECENHVLASCLGNENEVDLEKPIRTSRLEKLRAEIRQLSSQSQSNADIARKLGVSQRTVRRYLTD
ncbi:hypothetical protein SB5_14695 [Pseudomonas oryzihabitans]|nr:hypothetical protein SB5_14695 [Pseudomonas psychrotolerans]